jgi:acyl-CoA thioesterase FadM
MTSRSLELYTTITANVGNGKVLAEGGVTLLCQDLKTNEVVDIPDTIKIAVNSERVRPK